ncbi:MAG: hypothetical protein L0Y60_03965 [Beijerinckiaceae bacterium]|nr:hypothetical protein [Beijerinckiaceae bacterium]
MKRAGAGAALLAAVGSGSASAQSEIIDSAFSNCGSVNCSATSIAGFVGSFDIYVQPWVGKFLAVAGNCLRLEMSFLRVPAADLEMTVIGPNPRHRFRNAGGGTCTGCSLVKISPAPSTGFYTVVISSNTGFAVNTDFHLRFGQYGPGNVNCSSPTPVF